MVAPAPIALELVANPPPDGDLSRALVDACSGAAGPGGCVLADSTGGIAPRARIVVTFSPDGARVRVEVLATGMDAGTAVGAATGTTGTEGGVGVAASREVVFHEGDPRIERFRAAGLMAAGLAADLSGSGPEAVAAGGEPVRQEGAVPATGAVVRLGGSIGGNGGRPWAGAELGGDFGVAGPWFVGLSGVYGQTWARDIHGIAEQRAAFGIGAGAAARLADGRVEVRVRAAVDLQEVRASVVQPATGSEDAGGRTLAGAEAGLDLLVHTGAGLGVFAGARVGFWGDDTTVRVAGQPVETIQAWAYGLTLGLNVSLR